MPHASVMCALTTKSECPLQEAVRGQTRPRKQFPHTQLCSRFAQSRHTAAGPVAALGDMMSMHVPQNDRRGQSVPPLAQSRHTLEGSIHALAWATAPKGRQPGLQEQLERRHRLRFLRLQRGSSSTPFHAVGHYFHCEQCWRRLWHEVRVEPCLAAAQHALPGPRAASGAPMPCGGWA